MALYTRPLSESERMEIERGLRSSNGVWSRHCQILWASSQRTRVQKIAVMLNWHEESVREILRRFNREGLESLRPRKKTGRPSLEKSLSAEALPALLDLARQLPQQHDHPQPVWTSTALAETAYRKELLPERVSGKRLRRMLARQGYSWKLVKSWQTSSDPDYEKKNNALRD